MTGGTRAINGWKRRENYHDTRRVQSCHCHGTGEKCPHCNTAISPGDDAHVMDGALVCADCYWNAFGDVLEVNTLLQFL